MTWVRGIAVVVFRISDLLLVVILLVLQDLHLPLQLPDLLLEHFFLPEDHFAALADGGVPFLAQPDIVPDLLHRQPGRAQAVHQMQPAYRIVGERGVPPVRSRPGISPALS